MISLTCVCVLLLVARTLAQEKACCSPGQYLLVDTEAEAAECYALGKEEKTPMNVDCEYGFVQFPYENFVFKKGEVSIVLGDGLPSFYNIEKYCVHKTYDADTNKAEKVGITCIDPPSVLEKVTSYLLIVSVVFLILTVIIYSAFKELRDLFGKSFINMCGSLAIGFIIFATLTLHETENMNECAARVSIQPTSSEENVDQSKEDLIKLSSSLGKFEICGDAKASGFLAYYFLLTSFFWTTAISIQLFLNTRSPSAYTNKSWKTFAWYAIFAWVCPAILTISMAIVNFHPGDHAKPGIGIRSCWFDYEERPQIWYWFYSVLLVLISINVVIFIYIYSLLCRLKFASRQTDALKNDSCLALKIFGVMGLYWILELAEQIEQEENQQVIWKILTCVTSLQGLWIFLTWVVFRKRVIKALNQRGLLFCVSGLVKEWLENGNEPDRETIEHTTIPLNES